MALEARDRRVRPGEDKTIADSSPEKVERVRMSKKLADQTRCGQGEAFVVGLSEAGAEEAWPQLKARNATFSKELAVDDDKIDLRDDARRLMKTLDSKRPPIPPHRGLSREKNFVWLRLFA